MGKKTCVIVTCISTFSTVSFKEYASDIAKENISAILTNEAGTQYLFRKIINDNDQTEDEINVVLVLLESDEVTKTEKIKEKNGKGERESKRNMLHDYINNKDKAGEREKKKLACVLVEEQISEVIYYKKRMKYEWDLLTKNRNIKLDSNVIHINMGGNEREKCESVFMNHISELRKNCDDLEIYMDETGGPRDINYTFALLIRMLEYSNINCKDIVYSNINNKPNKISSILSKHQYVDIVTGIDEFVRYGKIEMLRKQFDNLGISQVGEGKDLLDAMQGYSEQLTLCNVKGFELANSRLKDAINSFVAKEQKEYILTLLLSNLKKKIALDSDRKQVPLLLKRCLENDMVQQGITIYNELVPKYIMETLGLLQINGLVNQDNMDCRRKLESLLHGMQIGECRFKKCIKKEDISDFHEYAKSIAERRLGRIYLDNRNGYRDLFVELLRGEGDNQNYGKYTCTYFIFKHLNDEQLRKLIIIPEDKREDVIKVVKDYLEMRELRNIINHASNIDNLDDENKCENAYRMQYFRLPALKSDTINYENVKRSLEEAIKNLEELIMNKEEDIQELLDVPVLSMYDIRGIQDYIFRTNRVKEIVGASLIVEDIIKETLIEAANELDISIEEDWENKDTASFLSDGNEIEVLFIGGGNAYVLYKTGAQCVEVNKVMSRKIIEKTYSLQLTVAVVKANLDKNTYKEDYDKLRAKLDQIKAEMPLARTLGALPITKIDPLTGFPLIEQNLFPEEDMSLETFLKLSKYMDAKNAENEKAKAEEMKIIREFDQFITKHGEESMLAIVHIDGNDMGNQIGKLLAEHNSTYEEAVQTMRTISRNINNTFKVEVFEKMKGKFENWVSEHAEEPLDKKGTYLRKIIVAGDDVTFICNARVALPLVKYFAEHVSKYSIFDQHDSEDKGTDYGFSICAGIAYINSHFPFHIGYKVAEACCDEAKRVAKLPENVEHGRIGNWVDFQICRNAQMGDLEEAREKNYSIGENIKLLQRPYHIAVDTEKNGSENKYNELSKLIKQIEVLRKYPRSKAMLLRNTYPKGKEATESLFIFLQSRDKENILSDIMLEGHSCEPFAKDENGCFKAVCYDALELIDLYQDVQFEGEE